LNVERLGGWDWLETAPWIKSFVPEVPVEFVKAGEPFLAPA
jgi:hypothetical protein